MAATGQFTANSSGFTAVIAMSVCQNVRILEDPGVSLWPTTNLVIAKPAASSTPVQIPGGQSYTFNSPRGAFKPGQIVGYVSTVTGSTTIDQDEDQPPLR